MFSLPPELREFWGQHRGKLIGSAVGLAFSLCVYWIGLLWTLFLLLGTGLGYLLGRRIDEPREEDLLDVLERLLSRRSR